MARRETYDVTGTWETPQGSTEPFHLRVKASTEKQARDKAWRKLAAQQTRAGIANNLRASLKPHRPRTLNPLRWEWLPVRRQVQDAWQQGGYKPGSVLISLFRAASDGVDDGGDGTVPTSEAAPRYERNAILSLFLYAAIVPVGAVLLAVGLRDAEAFVLGVINGYSVCGLGCTVVGALGAVRCWRDIRQLRAIRERGDG
mgnify:FL=1